MEHLEKEWTTDPALLEKLADLEHKQWISWSKALVLSEVNISSERKDRWKNYWRTRYKDLSEEMKEQDRVWARKVLETINLHMQEKEDTG